ncbi:hypothetical protein BH10CYA1_BH10CYA1_54640 [soil metagenome]
MRNKLKTSAWLIAAASAIPVLAYAAIGPHLASNAIFCDDGSFAAQGMFSGFVNQGGRLVWTGGGANPKVAGDEFIGLRLNGDDGFVLPAATFTFVVDADRDLLADTGAIVAYTVNDHGTITTLKKFISSAPGNGLVVSRNGNHFTITAPINQPGRFGNIYFEDEGSAPGVPFRDTVTAAKVDGKSYMPDVTHSLVSTCNGVYVPVAP